MKSPILPLSCNVGSPGMINIQSEECTRTWTRANLKLVKFLFLIYVLLSGEIHIHIHIYAIQGVLFWVWCVLPILGLFIKEVIPGKVWETLLGQAPVVGGFVGCTPKTCVWIL